MRRWRRTLSAVSLLLAGWLLALLASRAAVRAVSQPTPEPPLAGEVPGGFNPPLAVGAGEPVDPPTPAVTIRVRVNATSPAGQDLEYRISVVNRSRAAAHHVTVRNPVSANARFARANPAPTQQEPELVWRLGTLQPGDCREIVLVLQPAGEGEVRNCARVQYEHGQCVVTRVLGQPPAPAPVPVPAPVSGLTLRKTGPAQAVLFDPVTFRIEVANTGAAPLADVTLTDILPRELQYDRGNPAPEQKALLTWNLGTLAPGQQRVVEYQALALKEGTFTNRAQVTAAGGLRQEASARVTVGRPKLALSVAGPDRRYANLPALYEFTVTNPGDAPASNVVLHCPLPAGARFVSASDGGQFVEGEVRWSLGTLPAGGRKTLRLQIGVQKAGEAVLRGTVRADRELSATAEMKTLFQGATALTAQLTDVDPVEVGREVAYVLRLRNSGTADATEVKVTAAVPPQLSATDAQGPVKAQIAEDRVVFDPATVKAGEEVRYVIYVRARKPGDVRFRVDIEAKELTAGPLREEESTTIFEDPGNAPPGGSP